MPSSPPFDPVLDAQLQLMVESYRRLTAKSLLEYPSPVGAASAANALSGANTFATEAAPTGEVALRKAFWHAPFAIVAHGTEADPVFFYGNEYALGCFEMSFEEFTCLPSRLSAEPLNQESREKVLRKVAEQGFIDGYSGMRIAKSGRRFLIAECTIWNLIDETGRQQGQAAVFVAR